MDNISPIAFLSYLVKETALKLQKSTRAPYGEIVLRMSEPLYQELLEQWPLAYTGAERWLRAKLRAKHALEVCGRDIRVEADPAITTLFAVTTAIVPFEVTQ